MKSKKDQTLYVLQIIKESQEIKLRDIAEKVEISLRSVQRHCKKLEEYGFIDYQRGHALGKYDTRPGKVVFNSLTEKERNNE